jgi:hypothetical protein
MRLSQRDYKVELKKQKNTLETIFQSLTQEINSTEPTEFAKRSNLETKQKYIYGEIRNKINHIAQLDQEILEASPRQLQELYAIVVEINSDIVCSAYQLSSVRRLELQGTTDILEMLLLIMETLDNPLMEFVSRMIVDTRLADNNSKTALRQWAERYDFRLVEFQSTEKYLMVRVTTPDEGLTYHANALFIETLDPRQAEGAEWNFHFRPVKIDINPHRKYSVDELKGVLCRAVGFCNKNYSVETRDLIVECFLPISLLHLDVEQWPVQEGGLVCGGEFCKAFVVRTSDKSGFLQNKQSFWQQLWRNPTLNCSEALEIIDIANGYKYGNRENPQMVGYRFCVDRNHAQQMNFWGTFLQEGPPIALWIRDSTINPEVAETLMQSLMSRGIGTLVTDLTNYRRDPTILLEVAQVSLLWDNPFRPFPGSEPMFKSQSTTVGL